MHFVTQFSATAMTLLWGFPFLVDGEGLSKGRASLLLSLIVVAVMYGGPTIGWLIGRHPWHRSTVVLTIVWAIVATWTAVLAWPGDAPFWLLVVLTQVIGIGGPASMIGFDLARTSNPTERLASANGIINQAGFSASLVLVVAIGLVLDWRTPGLGERLRRERVPLGDGHAVPALGARPAPGLALPPPHPRDPRPRRADGQRASGGLRSSAPRRGSHGRSDGHFGRRCTVRSSVTTRRRQPQARPQPRRADSHRASRGVSARITSSRQSCTAST